MADYKRMVSYMYQYENGVKKKNMGYARVEAKGGQCKVTIHMQLLGLLDSIFPTYLIHRENNGIELIYLGDSILKNQIMDSKLTADEANVMGSSYNLSNFGGILLFLNDNVFYATEWDDKPIVAAEVREAMRPKTKKNTANQHQEEQLEVKQPFEKREEDSYHQTVTAPDDKPSEQPAVDFTYMDDTEKKEDSLADDTVTRAANISDLGLTLEEELKMPKYKLPRGWKTVEAFPKKSDPSQEESVFAEKNDDAVETSTWMNEVSDSDKIEELVSDEASREFEFNPYSEEENNTLDAANLEMEDREEMEDSDDSCLEEEERPDSPIATYFFEHYSRIYPFEDNEITLCVKVEPKDIGLFPKDLWGLSNNSFLMHGYYCYHHLIFAKIQNRNCSQYILGVPGIYHNREQFMARMFGFDSFKSIRKRDLRQGDFGYWYVPIAL